jgi:hypothetical protein
MSLERGRNVFAWTEEMGSSNCVSDERLTGELEKCLHNIGPIMSEVF